jgi:hypothetical protein
VNTYPGAVSPPPINLVLPRRRQLTWYCLAAANYLAAAVSAE